MKQFSAKTIFSLFVAVFIARTTFAQLLVHGKITDSKNQALTGVTVKEAGTSNGDLSDENGNYSFGVSNASAKLQFTYIGYLSQEFSLNGQTEVNVVLQEDVLQLNDVVVMGYSEKKKTEIASAVSVIGSEQLNDVTANNIGSKLQGKVPGLLVVNSSGDPGSAPELRIRGVASLSAPQGPLVVVDGIIGGNYDPNDVESVTVLRDAGATGLYGSQANGGVIIVTTKKGNSVKPQFEFSAATGFATADQGNLHMMNGRQLYETQKELYRDPEYHEIDLVKFTAERPDSLKSKDFNWVNAVFDPALVQNYYLSASGKSGKLDYYTGATYYGQGGTFRNTDYHRINFRANTTYHFNDRVKLTNNINLSANNGDTYDYNDLYYSYLSMPWDNPFDADGKPVYVDQNTVGWWSRDKINPIHTIDNSEHSYHGIDLNYDLVFDWNITHWLTFSTSNRLSGATAFGKSYFSPLVAGTYHDKGYLEETSNQSYGAISTNLLRFNFEKGQSTFSGLAGFELQGSNYEYSSAAGKGLPEGFSVLNVVSSEITVAGATDKSRQNSIIAQANYSFADKYFLTGSYRVDGSSAFPPDNRYAQFPSIAAAWVVSNENFMKNNTSINTLKLRLSYGITGMQDIGAYKYLSLFSLSTQYNSNVGAVALQLPSPDLTWEKTHQLDFGVDLALWNRVDLSVDVYHNNTKDLLVQVAQPTSTGFESKWENVGNVLNNGIEIYLNAIIVKTKSVVWDASLTFGSNKNKIEGLEAPIVTTGEWGISQIYENGGELYAFYLKKWAGVDPATGLPLWEDVVDDDGNPISPTTTSEYAKADNQVVGHALPKFQGGLATSVAWKGFQLAVSSAFCSGNDVYNNNRRFMDNDGHEPYYNLMLLASDESRWTQPGDIATHPSMTNAPLSTETSSRFLEDGSFWKIRNITLSYNFSTAAIANLKLTGLSIALSVDNPITFTNYWGQDPETTITPGDYVTPGVSDFKYPNSRIFMSNITVKF